MTKMQSKNDPRNNNVDKALTSAPESLAQLQEENDRLKTQVAATSIFDLVVQTDTRGLITYINDKFIQMSGYTKEEMLGKNPRILNSGYYPKLFYEQMWKSIGRGDL